MVRGALRCGQATVLRRRIMCDAAETLLNLFDKLRLGIDRIPETQDSRIGNSALRFRNRMLDLPPHFVKLELFECRALLIVTCLAPFFDHSIILEIRHSCCDCFGLIFHDHHIFVRRSGAVTRFTLDTVFGIVSSIGKFWIDRFCVALKAFWRFRRWLRDSFGLGNLICLVRSQDLVGLSVLGF